MKPGRSPENSPEDPNNERSTKMGRREWMVAAGMAAAEITALPVVDKLIKNFGVEEETVAKRKERTTKEPRRLQTGVLAGERFGGLYSAYTGITGPKDIAPKEMDINFQEQLRKLWAQKNVKAEGAQVVKETGDTLVAEYEKFEPTFSTLDQYSKKVAHTINLVKRDMDWDKLAHIRDLNPEQLALVRSMAERIDEKDLLSYSLTELMPSPTGKFNKQVLEFLLQNAGEEYIESIPAVHDHKTSFGLYQFTEDALYDDGHRREGASKINQALRRNKVPGSVAKLRGQQHHEAAFLFMIENYCKLVNRLNDKQMQVLRDNWSSKKDDLVVYAAMAHHGPKIAGDIAERWLDNNAAEEIKISAGDVYLDYARKTEANLKALR